MPATTQSVVAMLRTTQPVLPEPEHPQAHVDQDRADQEQTRTQDRHCLSGFTPRTPSSTPGRRSRDRPGPGSAPQLGLEPGLARLHDRPMTARSTSSPVSVRSGCRKTMLKWTLCMSSGKVSPPERVQVLDGFRASDPPHRTTVSDSSAHGKTRATTSERSRTTAGNGGSGAMLGHQIRACLNRTSSSSSAAEHASRSSNSWSWAGSISPR